MAWNFKFPGGDLKFDIATSNKFRYLVNKVHQESDIDKVIKKFTNAIIKSKFQSSGKRFFIFVKVTQVNDSLIWRQWARDIDKLHRMFAEEREMNQMYMTRAAILRGQADRQLAALEKEGTEEIIEDSWTRSWTRYSAITETTWPRCPWWTVRWRK